MSVIAEIQNTRIIRVWDTENSYDKRDSVEIKVLYRNTIFDRWLQKYIKRESYNEADNGWWLQDEKRKLSSLIFFKTGTNSQCSCSKDNKICIHLTIKKICETITQQKTGEAHIGTIIFSFLY